MARVHYADEALASGLVRGICGHLPDPSHATRDRDAVTCKLCTRRLDSGPGFAPAELTEPEPWRPPPAQPMADKLRWPDLPQLHRLARKGDRRARRYRWSSPEQAARFVLQIRADGYPSPSASGAVERIGETGTLVDTGSRGSSKAASIAEDVAGVVSAIEAALRSAPLPLGVSPRVAGAVWRDRRVGAPIRVDEWAGRQREATTQIAAEDDAATVGRRHGLDASTVTVVCQVVHRALLVELCARGLMRTPMAYEGEVEARRARKERAG